MRQIKVEQQEAAAAKRAEQQHLRERAAAEQAEKPKSSWQKEAHERRLREAEAKRQRLAELTIGTTVMQVGDRTFRVTQLDAEKVERDEDGRVIHRSQGGYR